MNNKKFLALLLALVTVLTCTVAGTVAFLTDKSETVTNTFELGDFTYKLRLKPNKPGTAEVTMPTVTPKATDPDTDVDGKTTVNAASAVFTLSGDPSTTGYQFEGWYYDKECTKEFKGDSGKIITLGYGDPNDADDAADVIDITLYAKWKQMDFKLSFDTQVDEVQNPADKTVTYQKPYGELPEVERTGYTFNGWYLDKAGTRRITESSIVNIPADHTVYAQWLARSYVIRYHANGGVGTMEDQIITYDVPTVLSKNLFTRNDYTFMGWALSANGEVAYPDEQTVVNLLESGTLDLYAIWAQNAHTVRFDYNGGSGSVQSQAFLNGKAYGPLPEYPIHPTKDVADNKIMTYLFTGWYTEKNGGVRVYPETIVNRTDDHTLYAHWEEAPSNQIIQNMIVKNNPDDNKDGVVDDIYLEFTCTSNFEKYNIPLKNLVPDQVYELTYTASNDASFGDHPGGYRNSVYGSYILADSALTGGRIETNYDESKYVAQVLANWNSRKEADGNNDGSHAAINDSLLQGPWKNQKITFTATQSTMYWTWDFGLMQDNIQNNYNITDIVLKPVPPKVKFASKTIKKGPASVAKIASQSNSEYSTKFEFDGDGGCETMYYPIEGLTPNATYTITFEHEYVGNFVSSTGGYDYGCTILNASPTEAPTHMSGYGTLASNNKFICTSSGQKQTVSLTFTPNSSTAYWVWNLANVSDSKNGVTSVNVKQIKLNKDGKTITFDTGSTQVALALAAHDELEFDFNIDIDELGAFANDMPTAGKDFIMEFNPAEGYEMPETILVRIDGVDHVYTLDDLYAGDDENGNALYQLWIPGEMLKNAASLYIEAKAVEITEPETEPSTEATEPSTEATEPSTEATEPSTEATEPSTEATEASTEATEPSGDQKGDKILDKVLDKLFGDGEKGDSTEPTETKPVETTAATEPSVAATEATAVTEETIVTEPTEKEEA